MKRFGWMWGFLLGLCLVGGLAAPGSGESPTGESLVQLQDVAVEPRDGGVAVQIKTSGPAAYQTALIDTPTRLVIDLESTAYGWRKTPLTVGMDPIRQIRGSQFKKGVSRLVLELTRKVGYRIEEGPEGLTVMLEPSASQAAPAEAEAKPAEVAKVEPPAPEAKPTDAKPTEAKPSPEAAPPAETAPPAPKAEAPKAIEPPAATKAQTPEAEAKKDEPKKENETSKAEPPRSPAVAAPRAPKPTAAAPAPIRLAQTAQTQPVPNGSRLISLDFKDADIVNILRILAAESGRNIVTGEDVKGKVSISLQNVPWELALETILEARGLQRLDKDNVIRIVSTEQLTKEREAKAKAEEAKVKGEAEARTKMAEAQLKEADARQRKLATEAAIAEAQARGPLREDTIRLNYADPEEVAKTLQGILGIPEGGAPAVAPPIYQPGVTPSIGLGGAPPIAQPPFSALYGPGAGAPAGAAAVGTASAEVLAKGLTIRAHKATNTIFLRLYEKDLERVKKLIKETLDVQLPQVKIEARMELLERESLFNIGIQWGGAGATRDGRNILVGQGFTKDTDLTRTTGIPQIPGSLGFPGVVNPAVTLANLLPVAAATGLPTGGNLVNIPFQSTSATFPSPAGGFNFGIIGTRFNLNLALQALEGQQKAKSLSRPEIVTVENKPAQMSLGEEIPYATVSSAGTQIQFKEAVLSLTVTPTVIREGDITKIKMKVIFENNERTKVAVGGVPVISKKRAETEVVVKEGEILVIGGVTQRTSTETIQKVPLLGDIPLLGWLFKTRSESTVPDRELIVFIAPSVVKGGSPYPTSKPAADKPKGP